MRLLFYIHGMTGGGAERVMATLMNGFVEQGHHVRVVYNASLDSSVYKLDARIEQVFLLEECPRKSSTIIDRAYRRVWKFPAIRKQALLFMPDFAISFIKTNNNDVLAALIGTRIPVIICDHTNVDRKYPLVTSLLSKILYPKAAAITLLTQRDFNKWKKKYDRVYYLPNPCEIDRPFVNKPRNKVVLGVGRVDQWEIKGFDILIKAWASIKDEFPDWKCQIAGDYSDLKLGLLRNEVGENAFKTVEFLGFLSDIYDYLESCEVFCLSSRIEGMPMALLEAMNLGCACVAFDCNTGPAEIIDDGNTGLLAINQDVDDLARKLELILNDKELRLKFHRDAKPSVQKYSTNNILKMWNHLFYELKSS